MFPAARQPARNVRDGLLFQAGPRIPADIPSGITAGRKTSSLQKKEVECRAVLRYKEPTFPDEEES